ncbi:MAG TPA: Gfo/Idh/MocA family oxidoreductase [Gaiellaceae bacterium]|nr:Gfo/Idh/MocA family oxidoreductase [Gaiellaceae bacterium]
MSGALRVGVVGCGVIAARYVGDSGAFRHWHPVACADLDADAARALAAQHDLRELGVEELIADSDVDLVLNLTPPKAHAALVAAALDAGKHVYTEKPLAATAETARELAAAAERRGLRLGCAPDTFLSTPYETGRRLIAEGAIGTPVGAAAHILVGGPDGWHPNAEMFYREGGGPLLDLAPYYLTALVSLLGPIDAVAAFTETPTPHRTLGAGARAGDTIRVEVPTHAAVVLRMRHRALATLTVSFETRGQYLSGLTVYGTEGVLTLPDANAFAGDVLLAGLGGDVETVSYESRGAQETRGIGIEELALAVAEGRPHRASAELALHVLEAAEAAVESAKDRRFVELSAFQDESLRSSAPASAEHGGTRRS